MMPKLELPEVEKIVEEAINNVLKKHQKKEFKELLTSENFSYIVNEIEEEAEKIYKNYEKKAVEKYIERRGLLFKDIFTVIQTIINNSLITSIANIRRSRAGSTVQTILVKALKALNIECEIARFKYKGYRPDIVIPCNDAFRKGNIGGVFVLAVKRTLRERWAEDIDVFKFPNSAFVLIKPDPDFTIEKAKNMVERGMRRVYIPDMLYSRLKNALEKEYGTKFKPLSELPRDLKEFLNQAFNK
jgi:hypothetical protein